MLKTPLGRLRAVALIEGASYVALLFVAMPLKYLFDMPLAVRVVGMAHGLLFVLLLLQLMTAPLSLRWRVLVLVASLLPFGPFFIDSGLREQAAA